MRSHVQIGAVTPSPPGRPNQLSSSPSSLGVPGKVYFYFGFLGPVFRKTRTYKLVKIIKNSFLGKTLARKI